MEEILDRLEVMKRQETTTYQCTDYLQDCLENAESIDVWSRFKMIEWCFQVIDFIKFRREAVCIAMSYLDRFLSNGSPRARAAINSRKEYQLAAMTSLYLAVKLFEPKIIGIALLTELGRGSYTIDDFRQMENDMLHGLKWHLNGPTAFSFMEQFLELLTFKDPGMKDDHKAILENAMYQIELSAGNYGFVDRKPSEIGIASLINSSHLVPNHDTFMSSLQDITGTNLQSSSIQLISKSMQRLQYDETTTLSIRRITTPPTDFDQDRKRMVKSIRTDRMHSPTCVTK